MPAIQFDESTTRQQQLLQVNQTLQENILQELRILAQQKAHNRSWALYYTRQLRKTQYHQQQQQHRTGRKKKNTSTATTTNCYGKRLERFFTDSNQSLPAPNADIIRRRQQLEASTFFQHTQSPWSFAQDQALQNIVQEQLKQQQHTVDWDLIAQILHQQVPTAPQRSPQECRIQHARYDPSDTNHSTWNQLVTHYKLSPPVNHPWTLPQDRLLLTCVAAAGPQHIWGTDAIVRMITQFFPHKTRKQIHSRIHQSLLNPNYVHDAWTLQEERKLVLLMKFYHEGGSQQQQTDNASSSLNENEINQTNDDDNENDSEPRAYSRPRQTNSSLTLYRASSHFPRNTKSVVDKWHRTLNPEQYTTRPFTTSEQQSLLRVMQEHPTIGWVQLSQQHFPHRHPHRLMLQWYEQATVEAFAQREELLQQEQQHHHQEQPNTDGPQSRKRPIAATALSRPIQLTKTN